MIGTTLTDRAVVRLSGEDVRGFLQGLVTNDVDLLTPERPVWTGLLSPQGKALFDFFLWAEGDDVLIDCEAAAAADLARRLMLYRLRRKIAIEPVPGLAVHWSPGRPVGVADPRVPELGQRWLAPPSEDGPGLRWLHHRLCCGVTEGLAELGSDKTLWLECNAKELGGVSFTKGCYVGQENTARMNYRNKVNRRLFVVDAEGPGERTRAYYPDLGLTVDHRRIVDLDRVLVPRWLAAALKQGA
jgi:folate-binding protein YgfZ